MPQHLNFQGIQLNFITYNEAHLANLFCLICVQDQQYTV